MLRIVGTRLHLLLTHDSSLVFVARNLGLAAEEKQYADNQRLDRKIDDDVGELRSNASAALTAEKIDIRAQLESAVAAISGVFGELNRSSNTRLDVLQANVSQVG